MANPSFLIIDDHPLFLEALQSTLQAGFPDCKVENADTIKLAKSLLQSQKFNLIMLDLRMPDASGFDALIDIRRECPKTPLVIISALVEPDMIRKIKDIGANGFIHKSEKRAEIISAVTALLTDKNVFPQAMESWAHISANPEADKLMEQLRDLTPQQFKVLTRVCEAKLNKQIAFELGVTETTIKAHITLIFKKLGVHSRTQAVLLMQKVKVDSLASIQESRKLVGSGAHVS
jgi:DNA-binding NarL/FixJ family response regulator